jgi:hypothetical protein
VRPPLDEPPLVRRADEDRDLLRELVPEARRDDVVRREPLLDPLRVDPDLLREELEPERLRDELEPERLRDELEPDLLLPRELLVRRDRLDAVLEPARERLPERCCRPPPSCCCWPSPSSPLPSSFLATPTAAGTAIPTAAPATTFLPVDIPSWSLSFSI